MADEVLRAIQSSIADGLHGLLKYGLWQVAGPARIALHRHTESGSGGRPSIRAAWETDLRDEQSYIIGAVAELLAHTPAGECLRSCPACGRPFVAHGRQTYCTRVCSDRVRVSTFRKALAEDPERKEKYLTRRRKAYAKKQRAKLGAGVRVGRR
jgi:hypothetical protein